ncbi:phosphoribosylglycinamide synthetase [Hymenobacter radiodurans]|uniref:phosphoribosylglycinamide synthetase n=1 Tax=Hymenobacter radiodurans TaxID=2496028 RepID=UPI0010586EFA|nr:phosphoribosylglycinamide synthetase [Hymenobacter radiodurans]
MQKSLLVASVFALSVTACSQEKTADTTTTAVDTPAAAPAPAPAKATAGVERAEAVAPAPAAAALSTQPGPKGTQVALTKARVVGDILNVELQYTLPAASNSNSEFLHTDIDQINYIDDATSRKYNILKDQQGAWMAMPTNSSGKSLDIAARKAGPSIVTLKFPAPPAESPTISLSVPEVGSFDGIAVQR